MKLLEKTIDSIVGIDRGMEQLALARLADQARPQGSLGVLEPLSARLAAIAGVIDVKLEKKVVVTCAGDHGVVEEGVSLFPQEVTEQMVHNFVIKGASINVLAKHAGAESLAADIGVKAEFDPSLPIIHKKVARGTENFTKGPAMTREQAVAAIEAGIEIVEELVAEGRLDMLGTGDMGIGNTTPSTAIIAVLSGEKVEDLTGRGTGINDAALQRKIDVIKQGIEVNRPDPTDPVDVLAKVGGYEIGALAGLVLGAAAHGIPVVCDGFISTAGALIAGDLAPRAKEYLFASHRSVEVGHTFMHDHLGVDPLLDLGFRLGEGTGAALTMELLDASTRILADVLTFEEVAIKDPHTKG
ncbi:nicotinate-nucleotide--dimethylbenzimidazole phosphoribosyltransferase [Desulfoluna spongiiphila]|uniref:Nicotinate-nucleotide--dimethylbenzimidazole phosphoribosyltransferase n=1 Tax=Desulfoluna spongiiphila TaxID=419481 RepID=A0A1G5AIV8_9BACT|nr:nicotinate-nucleotide--dimethylbenzimidazole phosphoribosyltransferase [Desulfoluna spongiiphila]SCX77838.1 nicotinate-nucleotide-dimethylbenzimidazole phosphoribosyltransferase [Desulfoluna spongiiphila]VVS90548.1 nicotinate-nucleotide-dimethylbenzimidazole phosphoribosyltransferase prokaryotic [Desulfoluna spongiiphila]